MQDTLLRIKELFEFELFALGGRPITVWRILYLGILFALVFGLSRRISRMTVGRLLERRHMQPGVRESIETLAYYVILATGIAIILATSGLNLAGLAILGGSLGIGLGFGLQHVVTNLAAGLVILIERPIKVGDRVEIGDVHGRVMAIGARATTIKTNDNVTIIVPNADFINGKIVNWTHGESLRRFRIPIGVSYREDPERVRNILLEIAKGLDGVMDLPAPDVWFDSLGESALKFELRVWTTDYMDRPGRLRSQAYFAVFRRFREEGIEFPFPQLDVHLHRDA